jgi:hypothetical protein
MSQGPMVAAAAEKEAGATSAVAISEEGGQCAGRSDQRFAQCIGTSPNDASRHRQQRAVVAAWLRLLRRRLLRRARAARARCRRRGRVPCIRAHATPGGLLGALGAVLGAEGGLLGAGRVVLGTKGSVLGSDAGACWERTLCGVGSRGLPSPTSGTSRTFYSIWFSGASRLCRGKSASLREDTLWANVVLPGPGAGCGGKARHSYFLDLGGGKLSKGRKGWPESKK